MTTEKEILEGTIERITFQSEESGYTVFKLQAPRQKNLITVVGEMPTVYAGEAVRLTGSWGHHPKHGHQFQTRSCEKVLPATLQGLEKYLGSGLIKGVGPVTAKRLIEAFGLEIVPVIEEQPERLLDIPKIGRKKQQLIVSSWNAHKEIQNIMVFLQGHGVSSAYAVKIYKHYGAESVARIEQNPYQLAEDIWGIGFKTADAIAFQLGHPPDAPARLKSGLLYALHRATDSGHLYLPENELLKAASELLGLETAGLTPALQELSQHKQVIVDTDRVYLATLYHAEKGIVEQLALLDSFPSPVQSQAVEQWLLQALAQKHMELSPEQHQAVLAAATNKVFVLTGGPGTGKTTVCQFILDWFIQQKRQVVLASPTGRAAKRLAEVTGFSAQTLHRLLKFDPKLMRFYHNQANPLQLDVLIVDEVSMIDAVLFYQLLQALPPQAQLILVGDQDQLPAVGPGDVLRHLLASGCLAAVTLTHIFRQASQSLIITNAHSVNQGNMPLLLPPTGTHRQRDAFFIAVETPEDGVTAILNLVQERLPKAGYHPSEIQVLCPMNRGILGSHHLNQQLQMVLNPPQTGLPDISRAGRLLRTGDRVIQLRNNYDFEVFNGDMGYISAIDPEAQNVTVAFPEQHVHYDFADVDELALAYALSVHKSQGSEYPVVILPVTTQHYMMLQRNLLYTAMTRARRLLILVGSKRAVTMAVNNQNHSLRYSQLDERLKMYWQRLRG